MPMDAQMEPSAGEAVIHYIDDALGASETDISVKDLSEPIMSAMLTTTATLHRARSK